MSRLTKGIMAPICGLVGKEALCPTHGPMIGGAVSGGFTAATGIAIPGVATASALFNIASARVHHASAHMVAKGYDFLGFENADHLGHLYVDFAGHAILAASVAYSALLAGKAVQEYRGRSQSA